MESNYRRKVTQCEKFYYVARLITFILWWNVMLPFFTNIKVWTVNLRAGCCNGLSTFYIFCCVFDFSKSGFAIFDENLELESRYSVLMTETERITKELQHALALRELCCADFDRAQRWLRDTEIQTSPEAVLTTAGVAELEKSLQEEDIISVKLSVFFLISVFVSSSRNYDEIIRQK